MKKYEPEAMVAASRYQNYFPTLPKDVQRDHIPGRGVKAEVLLFSPVRDSLRDDVNPPDQGECLI